MMASFSASLRRLCTASFWCVASLLAVLYAIPLVATQTADAVQIEYTTTRVEKSIGARPVTIETGTYLIAPDGRYRVDIRRPKGERLREIFDHQNRRVVKMDLTGRQATVGSNAGVWPGPGSGRQQVPGGPPSGMSVDSDMTPLGTRTVFGLTLHGLLNTNVLSGPGQTIVHTMELWDYQFPDPKTPPILIEQRFEAPDEIVEKRIASVSSVPLDEQAFEIPKGFSVVHIR